MRADSPIVGADISEKIGFPVAVKLVSDQLAHKTESGAVALNLKTRNEVELAVTGILQASAGIAGIDCQGCLIESMVENVVHELLVGVKRDRQFGMVMVIASGGVLVELMKDSRTLLLPTNRDTVRHVLSTLNCYPLLQGYRGRPKCNLDSLVETILKLAEFAESKADTLIEMDINPLMVLPEEAVAADALIRVSG
jgi:acyl-CoA synthetase (NDP forming)